MHANHVVQTCKTLNNDISPHNELEILGKLCSLAGFNVRRRIVALGSSRVCLNRLVGVWALESAAESSPVPTVRM